MNSSITLKMMKRPLLIAVAATFAAACASTPEHVSHYTPTTESYVGSTGPSKTGEQGAAGSTAQKGPVAVAQANAGWTVYRSFTFEDRSDAIVSADNLKAGQVADYLKQNPSYRVSIDGQNSARVQSVVDALSGAGVPNHKMQTSNTGDPKINKNRHVEVLVSN